VLPASMRATGCEEDESGANVLMKRHSLREVASREPPCFSQGATAQHKEINLRLTESVQEDKIADDHGHTSLPVSCGGSI